MKKQANQNISIIKESDEIFELNINKIEPEQSNFFQNIDNLRQLEYNEQHIIDFAFSLNTLKTYNPIQLKKLENILFSSCDLIGKGTFNSPLNINIEKEYDLHTTDTLLFFHVKEIGVNLLDIIKNLINIKEKLNNIGISEFEPSFNPKSPITGTYFCGNPLLFQECQATNYEKEIFNAISAKDKLFADTIELEQWKYKEDYDNLFKQNNLPPAGRTYKQHNFILNLNKKKFRN
jgi:hypothetical protein